MVPAAFVVARRAAAHPQRQGRSPGAARARTAAPRRTTSPPRTAAEELPGRGLAQTFSASSSVGVPTTSSTSAAIRSSPSRSSRGPPQSRAAPDARSQVFQHQTIAELARVARHRRRPTLAEAAAGDRRGAAHADPALRPSWSSRCPSRFNQELRAHGDAPDGDLGPLRAALARRRTTTRCGCASWRNATRLAADVATPHGSRAASRVEAPAALRAEQRAADRAAAAEAQTSLDAGAMPLVRVSPSISARRRPPAARSPPGGGRRVLAHPGGGSARPHAASARGPADPAAREDHLVQGLGRAAGAVRPLGRPARRARLLARGGPRRLSSRHRPSITRGPNLEASARTVERGARARRRRARCCRTCRRPTGPQINDVLLRPCSRLAAAGPAAAPRAGRPRGSWPRRDPRGPRPLAHGRLVHLQLSRCLSTCRPARSPASGSKRVKEQLRPHPE